MKLRNVPDLEGYDIILLNTSGGKDSQVMIHLVVEECKKRGILDKVISIHANLGWIEWEGVKALVKKHSEHYGIPLEIVSRTQGDLLEQVTKRKMWPDMRARYCTSDQKRGPIQKAITRMVKEWRDNLNLGKCRVLNCLGLRAEESPARAKKIPFEKDERSSNQTVRHVDKWLPIHHLKVGEVWKIIKDSGVEYHWAYDKGMPRLSCCFCIFAGRDGLKLAGYLNPGLLAAYVEVEESINHKFKKNLSLREIQEELEKENWNIDKIKVKDWRM